MLGQALLAKKMGKTRLIAETGAGQHGVATATAAALMGMECVVFMGKEDTIRQALNVYRMRLLGAKVMPGDQRHGHPEGRRVRSHAGVDVPHRRHPLLSRLRHGAPPVPHHRAGLPGGDLQARSRQQMLEKEGRLPDAVIACVGGGSNAIGSFYHFIDDPGCAAHRL